jgi:hypothetical protein
MRHRFRFSGSILLVLAFLVTFAVSLLIVWAVFCSPSIDLVSVDESNYYENVEWVGPVAQFDNEISISYLYTQQTQDWPYAEFRVTNTGSGIIYLRSDQLEPEDECEISSAHMKSGCDFSVGALAPGESTRASGPVFRNGEQFSLSISYLMGNRGQLRKIRLTVPNPGEPRILKK